MKPALSLSVLTYLMLYGIAAAATYHVDPRKGDDGANGSEQTPWRTIAHALDQLSPGDTLLLRGGRYREQVRCSLMGTAEKPIVIRGAPGTPAKDGEPAIIDAGLPEFFDNPAQAWEPIEGDLYQSTKVFRNATDVVGAFGDKPVALVTYYLRRDLVATNERAGFAAESKVMDREIYVGPGLWLDRQSGRVLARLAPTHNQSPLVRDYAGPSDPRKLPLIIATEGSTPLTLDGARYVRIENITLAGAAPDAVVLRDCGYVALDRLVVHCGGFRGQTSGHVRVTNSQFFGTIAPWVWRSEASTGCASGQMRDVARVTVPDLFDTSHEVMLRGVPRVLADDYLLDRPRGQQRVEPGSDDEASPQMTRLPKNHDWEVAHCEFRNGHDGVYLVGRSMSMHHCVVDNMEDDAVDFSSPVAGLCDNVVFERNLIRRCVTALSTHNQGKPDGKVFITGNVVDLRTPMPWMRPTDDEPQGKSHPGNCFFMHGSDHAERVESYFIYQNTVIGYLFHRSFYAHGFLSHLKAGSTRRVFNNLCVYLNAYQPPYISKTMDGMDIHTDNNLHWSVVSREKTPEKFVEMWRSCVYSQEGVSANGGPWEAASIVADPMLESFSAVADATNDYRPKAGSPAVGAGRELPSDWPGRKSRTIGALDPGGEPLRVGVDGRVLVGTPWSWNP